MIGPQTFNRRPATRAASFAAWGPLPRKIDPARPDEWPSARHHPAMGKVDPVVDDGDRPTCLLQQWAVCALTATDCTTLRGSSTYEAQGRVQDRPTADKEELPGLCYLKGWLRLR